MEIQLRRLDLIDRALLQLDRVDETVETLDAQVTWLEKRMKAAEKQIKVMNLEIDTLHTKLRHEQVRAEAHSSGIRALAAMFQVLATHGEKEFAAFYAQIPADAQWWKDKHLQARDSRLEQAFASIGAQIS